MEHGLEEGCISQPVTNWIHAKAGLQGKILQRAMHCVDMEIC